MVSVTNSIQTIGGRRRKPQGLCKLVSIEAKCVACMCEKGDMNHIHEGTIENTIHASFRHYYISAMPPLPASAPLPRGQNFEVLLMMSWSLSQSRSRAAVWESTQCEKRMGWAGCRWVNPGMTMSTCSFASWEETSSSPSMFFRRLLQASNSHSFRSVATCVSWKGTQQKRQPYLNLNLFLILILKLNLT